MSKFKDLSCQQFGYLTAIHVDRNPNNKRIKWLCKCECGNTCVVASCDLTSGHTQSCGCKKYESHNKTHGLKQTPLYGVWSSMKERCNVKSCSSYKYYGARGITVCDEWSNDFMAFHRWAMKNGYSDGLSIERIDVNGNYCPENCKWIPIKNQPWNRTDTVYATNNEGITKPLAEWCNILNFPKKLAYGRYRKIRNSGKDINFDDIFAPKRKLIRRDNQRIYQCDSNGELIKIWNNTAEIRESGLYNIKAILNCCYGAAKTHKNYIWYYEG